MQFNNQIIKYEPNLIYSQLNQANQVNNIYLPPREVCPKCNKVHYYNTDKEMCMLTEKISFLSMNNFK